jgi:hypothetical protein
LTEYAVIQDRFERIDQETLKSVFVEHGGFIHADASRFARTSHGIVWDRFDESHARSVADALNRMDHAASVVAVDDIPKLPQPRTIRWFEIGEDGLRIPHGIHGETDCLPWPKIEVLSAGKVAALEVSPTADQQSAATYHEDELRSYNADHLNYEKHSKLVDVLDCIGIDEQGERHYVRMPSDQLSYGRILGEATELSRFDRFLAIVDSLVSHCSTAIISPETRKLLVNRHRSSEIHEGDSVQLIQEQTLRNYNRWMLLKHRQVIEAGHDDRPNQTD